METTTNGGNVFSIESFDGSKWNRIRVRGEREGFTTFQTASEAESWAKTLRQQAGSLFHDAIRVVEA